MKNTIKYAVNFDQFNMEDVAIVGGKNASLGEMIQNLAQADIKVPPGFATTAQAFKDFLFTNQIDKKIYTKLATLDPKNLKNLAKISQEIQQLILRSSFSQDFISAITKEHTALIKNKKISLAIRSSATAEDLPNASFAGQQDSFLNVSGIKNVLLAIKKVYASLFNERAIIYRIQNGFPHEKVAISAGIQIMVRSDCGSSGVMFTLDTETGFDKVIFINASWGLGESIVQGKVNPDEFYAYKPSIIANKPAILQRTIGSKAIKTIYGKNSTKTVKTKKIEQQKFCIDDATVTALACFALAIENRYKKPMDIEWAQDGKTKEIYIVQARPETVRSHEQHQTLEQFSLEKKGEVITTGHSIGQKIGQGDACVITNHKQMHLMQPGQVLVADMTDPDWEPIMKLAKAIVTNRGGRTCHAAIVARELGIPAVVGCNDATTKIKHHTPITVSCAGGEIGQVFKGLLPIKVKHIKVTNMPKLPCKLCMNLADPNKAFSYQYLPNDGVGLVRIEFIINSIISIHPNALLQFKTLPTKIKQQIHAHTAAYKSHTEFYIEKLREGIATIAAAFFPKPIIVRFSDFKSNEYANLLGGSAFEPHEENPMIGFRGGSRYLATQFADCFALECEALKRVRSMGLTNTEVMLPFVRTVAEATQLVELLATNGLVRGVDGLKVILMCEIPSNALLADEFLEICDGFSIGSNDLTQLTLGLDRDSSLVAHLFDERNKAVKKLLHQAIQTCKQKGKYVGICGQAPSDYPEFAKWLLDEGIESISLTPDSIVATWLYLAKNQH